MSSQATAVAREVDTFEEYTLFSLERSAPALLGMMERSKRIAADWPRIGAMVEAAKLCQELAALVTFQDTLDSVFRFGEMEDGLGAQWKAMRERFQFVMDTMEDVLELSEEGPVKRLFSVETPGALNQFLENIPAAVRHVRGTYMDEGVPD